MEIKDAKVQDLENELDKKKQQLKSNVERFKEKIQKMKTSELMDLYPQVTDELSIAYMDVFWERFPFEVLEEQKDEVDKRLDNFAERIKKIEQTLELESRVLKRIDSLIQAISKKIQMA